MSRQSRTSILFVLSVFITLTNVVYAFGTSLNYNAAFFTDSLNCDSYEGDLYFNAINENPLAYNTRFFLTDTNNVILQIRDTTHFSNVLTGCYFVYAINYEIGGNLQGAITGNLISNITVDAGCSSTSNSIPINVCQLPDFTKIVSGKVFFDENEDGIDNDLPSSLSNIAIHIFEDGNQDGVIDNTDNLLATILSDSLGRYNYEIDESILGRSVTHVLITTDTSTIPDNRYYTTDNLETALFSTTNRINGGNNFGISQTIDIENEVWLDLNGNAVQESYEVGIPNIELCLINASPLLIGDSLYSVNSYMDTVVSDINGVFRFEDLPDCDWQIVVHYDTLKYVPTYDADGNILGVINFSLTDGLIKQTNNSWCVKPDCSGDLDFGFRLAGELELSGNVCIDDASKDGHCNTGSEEQLATIVLTLFNEAGESLGGVVTNQNGQYVFPNLFEDNYVVHFAKEQISFEDYFFITKLEATSASTIVDANRSILQKVEVIEDIFGVDFAFFPHPRLIVNDNTYTFCPGTSLQQNVSTNDVLSGNLNQYQLLTPPLFGKVEMQSNGLFNYLPVLIECSSDQFTYQVCDLITEECDTASVNFIFEDNSPPSLSNLPLDVTINCDEQLPEVPLVSSFDDCPGIKVDIEESSTQGEDGCSLYDYTISRTWTATDACGNSTSAFQTIEVQDLTAPDIFRIYTLPNGKKLVAGVAELTGERWKTIFLPIDFMTTPLIFTQIISANNAITPSVKTKHVAKSQFEIRLQKEVDEAYAYEKVAWIAIEAGTQMTDYVLNANFVNANELATTIKFSTPFVTQPAFFTDLQTTNNQNAVMADYANLNSEGVALKLVEAVNENPPVGYANEKIAYLGIEQTGDLLDAKGRIIGEVGMQPINEHSTTIALSHKYHNPIILVRSSNQTDKLFRISQISTNSFNLEISPQENLLQAETITYLVIEGSIPLYVPNFCTSRSDSLILGIDIIAIDNCDNSVGLSYAEQYNFNNREQMIERTWKSSDECGNEVTYVQEINCEGVTIQLQTFLQGALLGSEEEGLMRDDLRKKGLIPLKEPYTQLPKFEHVGSGGGEVMDEALLNITGANAIVDWVFLELRDKENFDKIIATNASLIQRNGHIISPGGDSIILFKNVPSGDYFISISHRNHLSLSSQNTYTLGLDNAPLIDFTNVFTPVNGSNPGIKIDNKSAQWSGDVNGDKKIIYQGPNNDPFYMFFRVLLDNENEEYLTNFISRGYFTEDFNMDGIVIFQGPDNDRSSLLFNTILSHPNNRQRVLNYIISIE